MRSAVILALILPVALAMPLASLAADNDARIRQIENGLAPAIVVAGRPVPSANIEDRMRATHTPGVSIAFFENGRVVWTRAWGLADVASGRPVTPDTLFQAGSISKSVTATGALRLVQDGRLDLDQDVNTRLRGWRVPPSPFTAEQKVTLRRLLGHTAGLTVHGYNGYAQGGPVPDAVQVLDGAPPANSAPVVSFATPGQQWAYSGGGYVATQLLMTEVADASFPDLMHRLVLGPAGMDSSTYDQALTPEQSGRAATGYTSSGDAVPGGHHLYPEMAAAGLWTTPSDLARFAIALQRSVRGSPRPLLGRKAIAAMMTRGLGDWGLGVSLGPPAGPAMFQHSGDDQGFNADLIAFTGGRRQGVAIMTNGDGGRQLIPEIVRSVANAYGWSAERTRVLRPAPLSAEQLAALAGRYEITALGATLTVTVEDNRLFVTAPALSPQRYEFLPETPTHLVLLELEIAADVERGPDGAISGMALSGILGNLQAVRKP
jgi:CubicO group peptidase (beta-lactamase class C family)